MSYTRGPYAAITAYSTADSAGFAGTGLQVPLAATQINLGFTLSSNEITVPTDGIYRISWSIGVMASAGTSRSQSTGYVRLNGSEISGTRGTEYVRQTPFGSHSSGVIVKELSANDTLDLYALRLTGTSTCETKANQCRLTVERVALT